MSIATPKIFISPLSGVVCTLGGAPTSGAGIFTLAERPPTNGAFSGVNHGLFRADPAGGGGEPDHLQTAFMHQKAGRLEEAARCFGLEADERISANEHLAAVILLAEQLKMVCEGEKSEAETKLREQIANVWSSILAMRTGNENKPQFLISLNVVMGFAQVAAGFIDEMEWSARMVIRDALSFLNNTEVGPEDDDEDDDHYKPVLKRVDDLERDNKNREAAEVLMELVAWAIKNRPDSILFITSNYARAYKFYIEAGEIEKAVDTANAMFAFLKERSADLS